MTRKDNRIKAYKVTFFAFDKRCVEYFLRTTSAEDINKELKHLCETCYIIKKIKVLLPRKNNHLLWHNRRKNMHKPPTQEELDKVDANIKAGTK